MKKFGKFEKRPEAAQKKQPNVKSALLQTYMVSVLCLVLCVTMFFGTSYAWFTSEVTNEGNEIYIGTLDVGLFKKTGETEWASLSEKVDGKNATNLFDKGIRWEPGFTALETIKVVNEGDLAFKYVLSFVDGKAVKTKTNADVTATISDIAKYFDVWVYAHHRNGNAAPAQGNYEAITKTDSGWVKAGPLSELLEGKIVLEGSMYTVRTNDVPATNPPTAETGIPAGTTDGVRTVDTYTIALHMNEDATSDVMGHKISLNVKLIAYQMASENDSFGNNTYDNYLVATETALREAFAAGGNVTLAGNVTMTEGVTVPAGVTVNLDLNGFNLNVKHAKAEAACAINNKGTLTIKDGADEDDKGAVTFVGVGDPSYGYGTNTINNTGKLVIDGATIVNNTDSGSSVAIDCSAGAELIIESGKVQSVKNAIRLCPFGDAEITATINDGAITGARAIQIQLPGSNASSAPAVNLTVNGGTFKSTGDLVLYSFSNGQSFANVKVILAGGTFDGDVAFGGGYKGDKENVTVTGGTFNGKLGRYLEGDGWQDIAKP